MYIELTDVYGFKHAIRGMRNPKNSWDKSDSYEAINGFVLGPADKRLALTLTQAGTEHGKYLRFIAVWVDLTLPLYIWKEFDTYKFVEKDSCSTMHKITSRPLTVADFEIDSLDEDDLRTIDYLNKLIDQYKSTDSKDEKEKLFRKIIQKLPESYLQKRTTFTNYAELRNIFRQRKNHKLVEWHYICRWIESLPYSELITVGL